MTEALNKKLADLRKPFPAEAIDQIPRGGITLDYVGHAFVTERLLDVDPEWTWEPLGVDPTGNPAIFIYNGEASLWIKLTVCGVTRIGVGCERDNKNDLTKQLVSDAIRNAAMRFGAALDLWKKHSPPEAAQVSPSAVEQRDRGASSPPPAPAGGGNPSDAWLDILAQPEGWYDNRFDKKNPKAPDFKAKPANKLWAKMGTDRNGAPGPEALWLSDAPIGFEDALNLGLPEVADLGSPVRAKTSDAAQAKLTAGQLEGVIVEQDEPW